jgi:type IV pilus assembly protein PilV
MRLTPSRTPMSHRIPQSTLAARARGFTLLEVLVSLVVLSIGLLGIGKLVLFSSRGNDSAYMRSQATALGYTILDAMRTNRAQAVAGSYQVALGAPVNPGTDCDLAACSATTLAAYDLFKWKSTMGTALPAGDGTVTTVQVADVITGTLLTQATITVQWNDIVAQQSFGAASGTTSIVLETIL